MTIGKKIGLGFGVLLALVATLAIVVLFHLADMNRQFSFVIQHDAPVIANARHLSKLVVDMETGQRGFVITGEDEFLEPYEKALVAFEELLDEEKALVSDNPRQVKLLEMIGTAVQEWQERAATPEIAMRRKVGEATVDTYRLQEIVSQGVGKRLMDKFMGLGHEIEVAFSEQGDWEGAFAVEIIEKCMADREDGHRGFLITGKEEFLDKYPAGEQNKLPEQFARLRSLVSDRGRRNELSEKIDRLENLAADWSDKAAEPEINARRIMNKHPESLRDVAALLKVGTGKRILDRIREDFGKFIEKEERLTAKRFASASRASRRTTNTTILLALASVIFGGIMATKITGGMTKAISDLRSQKHALDEHAIVAVTDPSGKITYANEKFCQISQYSQEELIGQDHRIINPGHHPRAFFAELWKTIAAGKVWQGEVCNRAKDGSPYWVDTTIVPFKDEAGRIKQYVVIRTDITERVDAQQRLTEDRGVLASINEALNHANVAARSASQAKSDFLANMSHEIRTPMTAILGFTENLLDSDLSETEKLKCVSTIRRNGEFLLNLINDILDLSKIEAGKMAVERGNCQPCHVIAEVASLMRVRANEKGLPFNIEYSGAIPETIQTDPTRLRQILTNLIGNAIKFTETGAVRLVTRFVDSGDAPCLQFDVIDTGRGMTQEQVAKLFQPFIQADNSTTREFGGTGLGLTISKRFAELLGGDITVVETEIGVGTTFRLTVATGPLDGVKMLEDPMSATVVADTANTVAQVSRSGLQGCRILLAEDGPDNQRLISFVLKKTGADVTVTENGKLAVDKALAAMNRRREGDPEHPFDIILMDMQMPVMDGYEATVQLRRKGYSGPIIALTAHAMEEDREKCIKAGCDDYATKPIDRAKLIALIEEYIEKKRRRNGSLCREEMAYPS